MLRALRGAEEVLASIRVEGTSIVKVEVGEATPPAVTAPSAAHVAAVGCQHLHDLIFNNALFKLEAFRRGAVDQVTAAMTRHRSAVAVQVQGCNVLKTITFKQDVVKGAAVESGIVRSLVEVLSLAVEAGATGATAEAVSMAEAALTALCSVCSNHEGNLAAAIALGALAPVQEIVSTLGPGSKSVAQRGAFAVALLSEA